MKPDPARLGLLPHTRHNTSATSIAMRFWARSIGDRNPRHVLEVEGNGGGVPLFVAHPCWLYSVHDSVINVGDAAGHPVVAGSCWTFKRPVLIGDRIQTVARLLSETPKTGRFAGASLLQQISLTYLDGHGDEYASVVTTLMRVSRDRAHASRRYQDWTRWRYTEEQLLAVEAAVDAEQVRGATPRYWEDVTVDQALPRIVRGPLSSEEMVLFAGGTRPIPGGAAFVRALASGEQAAFLHPRTNTYESYAAGLVDDESARQLGFPAAHDYGIDRISQAGSMVTNWMGDAGQLKRLNIRLLEPHMFGDTSWFDARVTAREPSADAASGKVQLEIKVTNQRGQVTAQGEATALLPLRLPGPAQSGDRS